MINLIDESRRRYTLARKAVLKGAIRKTLRRAKDYAKNLPFVLIKTPVEWENEVLDKAQAECKVRYVPSPYYLDIEQREIMMPPPEPGKIRVMVYRKMMDILFDSALCVDLDISRNGELDLYHVQKLWDLQNCVVMDSVHISPFYPEKPDILSPLALHVLMDNQYYLRVLERPTPGRRFARKVRLYILGKREACREQAKAAFYISVALSGAVCFMPFYFCWAIATFLVSPPVRGFVCGPLPFLVACIAALSALAWVMYFHFDWICYSLIMVYLILSNQGTR